ncbi:MAG: hypothetical protein J7L59_00735 [Nanoarchaeota archaeon]|nr:hypothetical protein [Nanoarchaeota archaeon]
MKCALCKRKIEISFLNKIKGTYVKVKAKLVPVCSDCQKKYGDELKNVLKV